ncbi:conserved hypothetical protein [Pirellula staleyi DSM 6068]|uniref:Cytochrome c domain-containing protein n=1 Tax=Pirellula staleyi (strain ATCC 27377 / DSM 6068 / ICPB 4128) TaxID=530564 RepID=D2R501_PIRSD|nr:hypothetical protein [Pirellula staleyi]ADB18963.1 conserved hypothetical protein [Pirellula staleyi DSM 6068]
MKKVCLTLAGGLLVVALMASQASALPPFNKEFTAKYVEGNSNAAFVEAVGTAKCNACHEGKSKKDKNEYGKAVAKFLTKADFEKVKADADAAKKYIVEGLEKAAAEKNAAGKTFGELIAAGELPGGPAQ